MPKLYMPPKTFHPDEKDLLMEIQESYMDLINRYLKESSVYVVGDFDEKFWKEIVLSKPKDKILDPVDEFPILLFDKLTHFGVVSIDESPQKEYYYGNSSLSLEDFTRSLLIKAIKLFE